MEMKRLAKSSEFLDASRKCWDCYKSGHNVSWKSIGNLLDTLQCRQH